ncbi:methyltransferase, putative [Luminiphilus syltensis NOR5-1B]|uniref:tRNA U34 carboxymethyltransferase n=1 Tax=Luminiphilus syltensis NOR5-1B TaxID=565045 RepID=B8KRU8_9GAMM|nr:tRNA 5-methoxyuridine(34)/uridine 5-oxyacetic acid(34) synthase CmoB [Luminiphilus syltensis]EED34419.1 methyltransferase, putative [Luminiphilus syltensis NOR5-1B]
MTLPPELDTDLQALTQRWVDSPLSDWLAVLPEQLAQGLSEERFGDLPRWREALSQLPDLDVAATHLNRSAVGVSGPVDPEQALQLETALRGLHPWRKGPFDVFGITIDTEWRSDWKWDRVLPGVAPLAGRRVLDVGCGSGYHCWRMLGEGASEVIGIDPTPLFILQFKAIQRYLQQPAIYVLPCRMEQLPRPLRAFDTVFSMGILYHRRSPLEHLMELRDALRGGGQLILETLVVAGDANTVLTPTGRYARMGNVWFLPSVALLAVWLEKLGFTAIETIDVTPTRTDEQRSTSWMTFQSLADFLDPNDPTRTIEGYPAPLRATLSAMAP